MWTGDTYTGDMNTTASVPLAFAGLVLGTIAFALALVSGPSHWDLPLAAIAVYCGGEWWLAINGIAESGDNPPLEAREEKKERAIVTARSLRAVLVASDARAASGQEIHSNHNNGNDQKYVDESAAEMQRKTKKPENEKD